MDNDKAVSVLNNLIETVKDGEKGFKAAADGLQNAAIKTQFQEYSRQRSQMTRELQEEVRRLGGDPEKAGSMAGAMHRGWIDIKSAVTGKSDSAILAEAERGEDVAKQAFEDALEEPLPPATRTLVQQQSVKVREAHDRVRDARDREKVAH